MIFAVISFFRTVLKAYCFKFFFPKNSQKKTVTLGFLLQKLYDSTLGRNQLSRSLDVLVSSALRQT